MAREAPLYDLRTENQVLRRHRDILASLVRLASTPAVGRETFFQAIASRVADALEIDHVKILRFRSERADLFLEAGVGWKPGLVQSVAFPSDMASHAGRCFQTAMPVMVEDIEHTAFRLDPSLADHGIRSLLNVAIPVDGASWGVLEVDSTVLCSFSEDTQEFMTAAAGLVGMMVLRTRAERSHIEALAREAEAAQRRKLLLSEMQHRVKNNFQTILAMIDVQSRAVSSEQSRAAIMKLADSVMAMALAHVQLSPTREDERISLAGYLRALAAMIEKPISGVVLEVQANEMEVGIDEAVPLGLIVNEAVTNAVKHAFDGEDGKIKVELLNHGHGEALLSICDNGKGMPEDVSSGSGLKLIDALARQVRGRVERGPNPGGGTLVRVIFPRPLAPRPA